MTDHTCDELSVCQARRDCPLCDPRPPMRTAAPAAPLAISTSRTTVRTVDFPDGVLTITRHFLEA